MEETLYDIWGKPIAYVAYGNEAIIYMWNGKPVAYLFNDMIYGFNGRHLGWYLQGIVWNLLGQINGFNRLAADVWLGALPFKGFKEFLPFKAFREYPHNKPYFARIKSNESLSQFLMRGV